MERESINSTSLDRDERPNAAIVRSNSAVTLTSFVSGNNSVTSWIIKGVLILLLLGFTFGVLWLFTHPSLLHHILDGIKHLGLYGNLVMVGLYILIGLPVSVGYTVMCLACGFIFGIWKGCLTVLVGIIAGSSACFWLCSTLFKGWVESKIQNKKKIQVLLSAVRTNSWKIVFMMRLTPVPFGIQNAIFAVSGIPFHPYIIATTLGMIPEGIMWVYMGSTARKLDDIVSGKTDFGLLQKILFGIQIAAAVILFFTMAFVGRRILKKAMSQEGKSEDEKSLMRGSMNDEIEFDKRGSINEERSSITILLDNEEVHVQKKIAMSVADSNNS